MKKKYFLSFVILLLVFSGFKTVLSQPYTVRGNVSNLETGDKVYDATISITPGTKSAKSDANGDYVIADVASGNYKIICSYPGLKVISKDISLNSDMTVDFELAISFSTETIEINRAIDRETPVAFTDITKEEIDENIHGQDAPLLAKGTPGLYSYSTDGVGNGESQLLIRGFNQNYVQVLINGIPTNDPESNSVYWSNWGSVSSNAGSIQIQRGAGSSLYGSGGFGGSFNILTNNPLRRFYGATLNLGSPMNTLYGLKLNTGLMKNKMSGSLNFERKIAEGTRISGRYEGYNYYLSGMFYPDSKQSLQLVLHGAPQEHGYSFSNNIAYFSKFGYKANPAPFLPRTVVESFGPNRTNGEANYGLLNDSRELVDDKYVNLSHNFFHKPQLELHYNVQTNPYSFIKGTFFYSLGRGAGSSMNSTGTLFALSNNLNNLGVNGMKRDTLVTNLYGPEGFVTNDSIANAIYLRQTQGPTLSAYQRISYSLHRQFGFLGSYKTEFGKHVNFTGGAEFRSWRADHPGHFVNLFSKDSITAQQYSFRDTTGKISTTTFRRSTFQGDIDAPDDDSGFPFGWNLANNDPTYRSQYRNYIGETPQLTLFAQSNFIFDKVNFITSLQYVWYQYKLIENMPSEGAIGQELTPSQINSLGLTQEGPAGNGKFYMRAAGTSRWFEFNLVNNTRERGFLQPKAGVNYNITNNFNAFANFSHVERFVDLGIYYNQGNLNPDAKDEKSNQFEAGIGWNSSELAAKLNGYYMFWDNKSSRIQDISKAGFPGYDRNGFITQLVGESEHRGIEFEADYSLNKVLPVKGFNLKGSMSYMDNLWKSVLPEVANDPTTGKRRAFNTAALNANGNVDTLFFDELPGTPVASGPQFIFSFGTGYQYKGFFVGLDLNYYAKDFLLDGGTFLPTEALLVGNSSRGEVYDLTFGDVLPTRAILDGQVGYKFNFIKSIKGLASVQVLNILDHEYLAAADRFGVIPGVLRTFRFNLSLGF